MNDATEQTLLEASWRRPLTPDEQARLRVWLAQHPEAVAGWQEESALSGLLEKLPEAPLASNFTAKVLRAVEAEQARRARSPFAVWWEGWQRSFSPKLAWAAVALLVGLAAVQEYHYVSRTRFARDLAKVPAVAVWPAPEVLQDFDSIQQFSHVPVPAAVSDQELLTALE